MIAISGSIARRYGRASKEVTERYEGLWRSPLKPTTHARGQRLQFGSSKAGVRYRYYVSQPGLHGEARIAALGSVSRVPAPEIEQAIVSALEVHLAGQGTQIDSDMPSKIEQTTDLISRVARIEVQRTQLVISMKPGDQYSDPEVLSVPWQKPPSKRFRRILPPQGTVRETIRPERAERRARLVGAIARGRRWLEDIVTGSVTDAEQLAKRERCTVRQVNLTLSLAFLAPQLVKSAVEGRACLAASTSSICAIWTHPGAGNLRHSA
jgi:site-specific DNA recombinase